MAAHAMLPGNINVPVKAATSPWKPPNPKNVWDKCLWHAHDMLNRRFFQHFLSTLDSWSTTRKVLYMPFISLDLVTGYSWCQSKFDSCPVDCGTAVTCRPADTESSPLGVWQWKTKESNVIHFHYVGPHLLTGWSFVSDILYISTLMLVYFMYNKYRVYNMVIFHSWYFPIIKKPERLTMMQHFRVCESQAKKRCDSYPQVESIPTFGTEVRSNESINRQTDDQPKQQSMDQSC